jgi:hypothetical protein
MRAKWEMMRARIPNKVRAVPGVAGSAAEPDAEQVAREAEYRELRRKLGIAAALSAPVLVNFVSVLIIACQRARVPVISVHKPN